MKTRDFISGIIIMLFIGLMLTSCRKPEKKIIGEWEGFDTLEYRKCVLTVNENCIFMLLNDGNGKQWVNNYGAAYYKDNNVFFTHMDDSGYMWESSEPFYFENGKLYFLGIEWERVE